MAPIISFLGGTTHDGPETGGIGTAVSLLVPPDCGLDLRAATVQACLEGLL